MDDFTTDFSLLRNTFGQLIQAVSGKPVPSGQLWKNDGQVLLIKAYRHLESIESLSQGVVTVLGEHTYPRYVDHSSIAVLGRAAFETYMLFYFIFCDGVDEQRQLRHRIWKMIGFKERQRIHGTNWGRTEFRALIESEKQEIERLERLIRDDRQFRQFTRELQDKVLKKDDVKIGRRWMDLAELAGFPRKYAFDMYSHFCNYAHSGAISVFQIHDAIGEQLDKKLASSTITFCALLMSQLIFSYASMSPDAERCLHADVEAFALADFWRERLPDIGQLYTSA